MFGPILKHVAVAAAASAIAFGGMSATAQQVSIKIGHPLPPKTGLHVWGEFFKSAVEKRAPGRFKVQIYPTSQLGTIPRMIEGAQLGIIEMIQVPPAFLSGVDARYSILAAPGIFDDIAHGQRTVHDPEFKKAFWSIGEAKGLKLIGMSCDGPTDYATVKPIHRLADFKGRKLRVFGSKLEIETLRRVGATGVPMPLAEVIPAIQQRTIDGNKAAMVVFVPFKYQTIAKYVLKAKSSIICITRFASKSWFQRLPREVRAIILEEAKIADGRILPWNQATVAKLYGIWKKTGGVITELPPAEQGELKRRLSTVGDDVLKKDPAVFKIYELMKRVAKRTRKM